MKPYELTLTCPCGATVIYKGSECDATDLMDAFLYEHAHHQEARERPPTVTNNDPHPIEKL